jgi:hypothetical protein
MKKIFLVLILVQFVITAFGQQYIRCGSSEYMKQKIAKDPSYAIRMQQIEKQMQDWIANHPRFDEKYTITIPVVVHVVWNTSDQNISDAQVQSQIDVLNEDYNRLNADASLTPPCFDSVAGRMPLHFCLASRDPNGNYTNGITRTQTNVIQFSDAGIDNVKFDSTGGCSVWNPDYYLNIWVCNLGGGLLGLTQFPGGPPATDGPVVLYNAFGRVGNLISVYNLGRTATHEVGHWMNLIHPWGDDGGACTGTDYCGDTPNEGNACFNCPSGVLTDNCTGLPCGIMYQNFLDYTEDACMNMFTKDQVLRMMAALNGPRSLILSSNGCTAPTGIYAAANLRNLNIFPNPANTQLTIEIEMEKPVDINYSICNVLGSLVYENNEGITKNGKYTINTENIPSGIYFIQIKEGEESFNRKVIIIH